MAKSKTKKTSKKTTKEKVVKRNKYGHSLSKQSGFIDQQVEAHKAVDAIIASWNKAHPENPMNKAHLRGHIKHLILKHGLDKKVAQQILNK